MERAKVNLSPITIPAKKLPINSPPVMADAR